MGARNRAAGSGVAAWAGGERTEEVGVCALSGGGEGDGGEEPCSWQWCRRLGRGRAHRGGGCVCVKRRRRGGWGRGTVQLAVVSPPGPGESAPRRWVCVR